MGGCLLTDNLSVGVDDVRLQLLPPRPGGGRRALAGDVARAAARQRAVAGGVAAPPAPRRLLAARLGMRGLRGDPGAGARRQRVGRRLHQRRLPAARRDSTCRARASWARGRTSTPTSASRAGRRVPAGAGAVVGPLAVDADNGVMDGPCCGSGCRRASRRRRPTRSGRAGGSGRPSWPSPQVHGVAHPLGDHRILAPGGRPAEVPERLTVSSPLSVGPVRRQVVLLQRPTRPALRPARGGRRLAGLRRRGAHRAAGDPRGAGGGAGVRRRPTGGDGRGAALGRRARRPGHPDQLRAAQPHPPRWARAARGTGPGRALPGAAWR